MISKTLSSTPIGRNRFSDTIMRKKIAVTLPAQTRAAPG